MAQLTAPRVGLTRDLGGYLQIVRGRLKTAVVYRQNSLFFLAIVVVQIFILRKVWSSLYVGHSTVAGLDKHSMMIYLTIVNVQAWVMTDPTVSRYMYERVRQGQVAFDLIRPSGFVPQMFAHLVGALIAATALMVPALPLVALAGTLAAPASPSAAGFYVLSLGLGLVITSLITLMLGMVAFWAGEIMGLAMLYRLVNQFFAGVLVPLAVFPTGLRVAAQLLPFQSTGYTPVSIYVGRLSGLRALAALGEQAVWVAILALAAWFMWRRALLRVVVQGG